MWLLSFFEEVPITVGDFDLGEKCSLARFHKWTYFCPCSTLFLGWPIFLTKICCCKPWFLLGLQSQHKMSLWVFSYFCMITLYANHQKKSRATKSLSFGAILKISSSLRSHCCKMRHFEWFLTRDYHKLLKKCPMFSRLLTLFLKSHHRTPSAQLATKQSCQITIFCQKSNFQKTPKYYDDIYYVSQNKVPK